MASRRNELAGKIPSTPAIGRGGDPVRSGVLAGAQQPFAPGKLTRKTLNDQIYAELKEAIISGHVAPGRVLTIRELADSFGVSMMPVREALSRLIAEQVLVLRQNRSVAVPVLTAARFAQITKIRLMLEGMAAADGAEAIAAGQIDEMAALNDEMERCGPGDSIAYLDLNRRFHFIVYKASEQDYLVGLIEALWMQVGPLLNLLLQEPDKADARRDVHHHALLAALRLKDPAAARDAVVADIGDAADIIHERLAVA